MNFNYYKRIAAAYLLSSNSNISFWHTPLKTNYVEDYDAIGRYYMNFEDKTGYKGPFDSEGIPVLDYKSNVGLQYNPNAIAQYALGHYDLFLNTDEIKHREIFLKQANWLVTNIRMVNGEVGLWEYNFDFEYHKGLKAPWRSALAQGQGISVLVRAYSLTKTRIYLDTAAKAFRAFEREITEPGGVSYKDKDGNIWFEELIFNPPTHVLNGFIWAMWGVYDFFLATKNIRALQLFNAAVRTLEDNLHRYDTGNWSLYHLLSTKMKMIASPYYQRLHIIQLNAMHQLTQKEIFKQYAEKWQEYYSNWRCRYPAIFKKCLFKLFYY